MKKIKFSYEWIYMYHNPVFVYIAYGIIVIMVKCHIFGVDVEIRIIEFPYIGDVSSNHLQLERSSGPGSTNISITRKLPTIHSLDMIHCIQTARHSQDIKAYYLRGHLATSLQANAVCPLHSIKELMNYKLNCQRYVHVVKMKFLLEKDGPFRTLTSAVMVVTNAISCNKLIHPSCFLDGTW